MVWVQFSLKEGTMPLLSAIDSQIWREDEAQVA